MDIDWIRNYCLAKKCVEETFPFGPDVLVFKVMGKMFLLCSLNTAPLQLNIKCTPENIQEMRENYSAVLPGYHMNKKHWNTVILDGTIPKKTLQQWIDESYELIVKSLPKNVQQIIKTE